MNKQELVSKLTELKKELIEAFIEDNKHLDFIIQSLKELSNE